MITAIAIDDEPMALEVLMAHASELKSFNLVACFTNVSGAVKFLSANQVDLLLLDINIKNESGLEFAKQVYRQYAVIFTTAYNEYAVKAYDIDAVDYLLKPISKSRFKMALDRAFNRILIKEKGEIFIKDGDTRYKINTSEILYLQAAGNYLKIYCIAKTIICRNTLKNFLDTPVLTGFVQTHKSYAVNTNKIIRVESGSIILQNEIIVPLSNKLRRKVLIETGFIS